jgi:hypothetical protein
LVSSSGWGSIPLPPRHISFLLTRAGRPCRRLIARPLRGDIPQLGIKMLNSVSWRRTATTHVDNPTLQHEPEQYFYINSDMLIPNVPINICKHVSTYIEF